MISRLLMVLALSTGCGFSAGKSQHTTHQKCASGATSKSGNFCAGISWFAEPQVETSNRASILFSSVNADAIVATGVKVYPWMKIHGHGSGNAVPTVTQESNDMVIADEIYFVMTGPWELNVSASINGEADQFEIPVDVAK